MMHPDQVCDGRTYLQFRSEWRTVYKHLTGMIRYARANREVAGHHLGGLTRKCVTVSKRRPNTEVRQKRLARFLRDTDKACLVHSHTQSVHHHLRYEARCMMRMLEEVKARRPPPKLKDLPRTGDE